jgi:hypothetical protein
MSVEHIILSGMLLLQIVVSLYFIRKEATDIRERMQSMMHGQEHIAELVAEVLRRTPER